MAGSLFSSAQDLSWLARTMSFSEPEMPANEPPPPFFRLHGADIVLRQVLREQVVVHEAAEVSHPLQRPIDLPHLVELVAHGPAAARSIS